MLSGAARPMGPAPIALQHNSATGLSWVVCENLCFVLFCFFMLAASFNNSKHTDQPTEKQTRFGGWTGAITAEGLSSGSPFGF